MYAVIFRARLKPAMLQQPDPEYATTAAAMRQRAFERYGCLDFSAVTEGDQEIAVSWWPSQQAIQQWQQDELHQQAQQLGKQRWYASYHVDVVAVERQYQQVL
ncbi:antibiotic biosynthesis monooxygenase family protein [Oceanobacter mangrovi]|uniref:antibiotic biosynthesis monooxygenase family protein n=1 Tax=Oceanobacter mangrovi TaxID=2862510 RepID=UPI001C8E6A02|nr:antibiotic biosynthesis monooxygenase [Oceanobacter mangrovi]